ncbi:hypothetical protein JCM10213_008110 [Rhodosporidiobolus nylandii]
MAAQGHVEDGEIDAFDSLGGTAQSPSSNGTSSMDKASGEFRDVVDGVDSLALVEPASFNSARSPSSPVANIPAVPVDTTSSIAERSPSRPPSNIPPLPIDLHVIILASPSLDQRDLLACSLVSHTFRELVRPHLSQRSHFELVYLPEWYRRGMYLLDRRNASRLAMCEDQDSHEAVALVTDLDSRTKDESWMDQAFGWLEERHEVDGREVLQRLFGTLAPHLTQLTIQEDLEKNNLDVLCQAMRDITFPCLTTLIFPQFPVCTASSFPALKNVECLGPEEFPPGSALPPFALETLRLWRDIFVEHLSIPYFQWLTAASSSSLHTICGRDYDELFLLYDQLPSLTNVHLELHDHHNDFSQPLPPFPSSLRALYLSSFHSPHPAKNLLASPLAALPPSLTHLSLPIALFHPHVLLELVTEHSALRRLDLRLAKEAWEVKDERRQLRKQRSDAAIAALSGAAEEAGVEILPKFRSWEELYALVI